MASALEHFVNNIRTNTGNLRETWNTCTLSVELLAKNSNYLDNVLETLDPWSDHSMGVMFVLIAKLGNISGSPVDSENITLAVRDFIQQANVEQIRFAATFFYELCHLFTNYLVKHHLNGIIGIPILIQAIAKVQPSESKLTAIHADLCLLCLSAKMFKPALPYLEVDVTSIAITDDSAQDSKYFLLYYYYGGMIYAALKNYERALYFFEVAISTNAMAMSHIMLESYKKFILISLIVHGKVLSVPKYSSQAPTRYIKSLSMAYQDLATVYKTGNCEEVRNTVAKFREVFVRDTNMGLVKQVTATMVRKNIQKLTRTFLTLSLADVASRVILPGGAAEAEEYILSMIKSGEIFATINQRDGMVVFKDDPQKYDSPEMFLRVQKEMAVVMNLNKQIQKMEENIMLNLLYVKKSTINQNGDDNVNSTRSYETL